MQVVLARRRVESYAADQPPEVHAYMRSEVDSSVWLAPCGSRITPDDAEIVQSFTGVPCSACGVIAALATPSTTTVGTEDAVLIDESGRFGLSWRERVVHAVADDSMRAELGGRSLVMGMCGFIGWGPVASKPAGWHHCPECRGLAP